MYRRRSHTTLLSRCASAWSSAWGNVRFYWHTTNKTPWVVVAIVGVAVAGFAVLLQSLFADRTDRQNLNCLALNVYYEARGEPRPGQYAVAEVTMNRVASGYYPDTVCGVVYQKQWDPLRRRYVGAFSWTELTRRPSPEGREWRRAWEVAETVYHKRHVPKLDGVLHYHAVYIKPSWSRGRKPVARIGKHVFYKS
jgi:spore germination cell wall hydrolase CwlJ-like protein